MKGLLFIYVMTAFGVVGSVVNLLIGLFVYILFATLRPHYLWGFAGDLGRISQYVALTMLANWTVLARSNRSYALKGNALRIGAYHDIGTRAARAPFVGGE